MLEPGLENETSLFLMFPVCNLRCFLNNVFEAKQMSDLADWTSGIAAPPSEIGHRSNNLRASGGSIYTQPLVGHSCPTYALPVSGDLENGTVDQSDVAIFFRCQELVLIVAGTFKQN